MTVPLRIVVAEDAAIMRDGLVQLLKDRGYDVIAAVGDAEALRRSVAEDPPDVAIVDIRMPPTNTDDGLRAALAIRHDNPEVGVLMFSQYVETRYAAELVRGNASGVGYLLKDRVGNVREFVEAIDRVGTGGTALDPEVVRQLLSTSQHDRELSDLTLREREVLDGRGKVERRNCWRFGCWPRGS